MARLAKAIDYAKAIAFAKWSLWLKIKTTENCEKRFNNTTIVWFKITLEKTSNIREMRPFKKSAILQRLKPRQRQ